MSSADYTLRKEFPLKPEQNEAIEFMLQRPYCVNALQTWLDLGKLILAVVHGCHVLLKYPDTHLIILCPQKAVKAFKRELTQKLRVAYNELTSANKNINPNARITIITHSMLKNNLDYISELKAEGKRLILIVDEAHCCDYDTLIQTNLGELKIGDIVTNKIKCKVFSYNEKLDLIEAKPIIDYFENECLEDMYEVEYVVKGKIKKVKLTGGHPVFTKNRGYVEVENLTTEDIILSVSNHCENCGKELKG